MRRRLNGVHAHALREKKKKTKETPSIVATAAWRGSFAHHESRKKTAGTLNAARAAANKPARDSTGRRRAPTVDSSARALCAPQKRCTKWRRRTSVETRACTVVGARDTWKNAQQC